MQHVVNKSIQISVFMLYVHDIHFLNNIYRNGYDRGDVYINKRKGLRYAYAYGTEFSIPSPFPYVVKPGEPDPIGLGLIGMERAAQIYTGALAMSAAAGFG